MKKQNENKNIVTKQETEPVGAISIARRVQRKCLKHTQNGITLVALVITIIILLILAGVTINLTLGERGIFRTAEKAAKNYRDSQQEEMYGLNSLQNEIDDRIGNLGNIDTIPNIPVTNIEITPNSDTIMVNETVQLTAKILPSNATNKDVTWSSSNSDVATVAQDGKVTGVAVGTTTITATAKDGSEKQGSCTVTVKKVLLSSQITPANYGDYVNYEDGQDLGSSAYGHKTDWRIFYEDSDGYVYLISSYFLPYSQVPPGTDLQPYSERPYAAYWPTEPSSYTKSAETSYARYKMNFKYNGNYNNGQINMKCVSQLMNTSIWNTKFKNETYAEDAIGAPTLEMWVDSWNTKSTAIGGGYTTLTTSIPNANGYYINGNFEIYLVSNAGFNDNLYFPQKSGSDANGNHYWLASPSAYGRDYLVYVDYYNNGVSAVNYTGSNLSVRPLVRLKNTINGIKDANSVWQLQT